MRSRAETYVRQPWRHMSDSDHDRHRCQTCPTVSLTRIQALHDSKHRTSAHGHKPRIHSPTEYVMTPLRPGPNNNCSKKKKHEPHISDTENLQNQSSHNNCYALSCWDCQVVWFVLISALCFIHCLTLCWWNKTKARFFLLYLIANWILTYVHTCLLWNFFN